MAAPWISGCRVKRIDPRADQQHTAAPLAAASGSARSVEAGGAASARSAEPGPAASTPRAVSAAPLNREVAPSPPESSAPELPPLVPADLPPGAAAVAFSGPGSDPAQTSGLTNAVRHTLRALTKQSSPLEAAVAGTTIVEDDPLLNAGTGAVLRLDGSAELEVLLMDSDGRIGGVAAVRNVQHPVRLAFAATSTPHFLLVGDGAQRFANWLGLPSYDPRTPRQLATHQALSARFVPGQALQPDATVWTPRVPGPGADAWRAYLSQTPAPAESAPENAAVAPNDPSRGSDSETPDAAKLPTPSSAAAVAVLVRGGPGRFAGAIESGGSWLALPGSVGAIATPGAALYVAGRGAVAVAGPNELLVTNLLARRTYDKLLAFQSPRAAAEWALGQSKTLPISIVVMDARNIVTLSNADMAWAKADPNEKSSAAPNSLPTPAPANAGVPAPAPAALEPAPTPTPTPTPETPTR